MFTTRTLSIFALALQTGCLVDVELDVPETCVVRTGVIVPSADAAANLAEVVLGPDELSMLPVEAMRRSTLTLHRVEVKSDQDLSFVNGVALSLEGVELVTCTRETCAGGGEINLGESMNENGEVSLGLRVDGELPANEWTADVTVCFEAKTGFSI